MQLSPFHGCGEQDPEDGAPSPRQWQWQGRVLGPPDPVLFLCHQTECQQGPTVTPSLPTPSRHSISRDTTAHGCQHRTPTAPGLGEWTLSLLCFQPGTPAPLPLPPPGISAFREGGDRTSQAMRLCCSIPAKGSAELKESRLEPLRCPHLCPGLRAPRHRQG